MRRFAILFTLLVPQAALAGVRIEFEVQGGEGTGAQQRMQLQGDKLRVDHTKEGGTGTHTVIFDGTQMTSFDGKQNTYVVIDPARLKMQAERLKQLEAKASPETRAQIEKATQQEDAGQVTFRKTSGGDTVAGYSCSNYTELRGGVEHGTVCVASWKTGPVKKEELGALSKFGAMMLNGALTKKALLLNPDEWPGFPLSMHLEDGKTMRLKSVTRGAIPDSEFQPPTGYTQKAMPPIGR